MQCVLLSRRNCHENPYNLYIYMLQQKQKKNVNAEKFCNFMSAFYIFFFKTAELYYKIYYIHLCLYTYFHIKFYPQTDGIFTMLH